MWYQLWAVPKTGLYQRVWEFTAGWLPAERYSTLSFIHLPQYGNNPVLLLPITVKPLQFLHTNECRFDLRVPVCAVWISEHFKSFALCVSHHRGDSSEDGTALNNEFGLKDACFTGVQTTTVSLKLHKHSMRTNQSEDKDKTEMKQLHYFLLVLPQMIIFIVD